MSGREVAHRWPWLGWAVILTASIAATGVLSNLVLGWPETAWLGLVSVAPLLPIAWILSSVHRTGRWGRSVLAITIEALGIGSLVVVLFLGTVVVFGRRPDGDERGWIALCFGAALVACALSFPVRSRLRRWIHEVVLDDARSSERLLGTFGARMTRAVPMDELLLQVVELLHRAFAASAAEVWTGEGGDLVLAASLPQRECSPLQLDTDAHHVAARAGAQGNTWLEVWVPDLLQDRGGGVVRSIPIPYRGELMGMLVVERPVGGPAFAADEDRALVDLARQLGLALHNLRLDSALRASVRELERSNAELTASRARIVSVADESRRTIERDLHDGAQQHLVALAIEIGLIRSTLRSDPVGASTMLEDLAVEVEATIDEVRELAHGIYPPRLRDRGLAEALATAAHRAGPGVIVDADRVGRYPEDIEAAVYFCCLEAIQNSTKHAGCGRTVVIRLSESPGALEFTVSDDGQGFDSEVVEAGQGITNMRDRIGATGGHLTIDSTPGEGTTVCGVVTTCPVNLGPVVDPTPRAAPSV